MDQQHNIYKEEQGYLVKTQNIIIRDLHKEEELIQGRLKALVTAGKNMWEDSNHYVNDFDKLVDMNQFLAQFTSDNASYTATKKKITQLKLLNKTPYFGRFDFKEEFYDDEEKIYIGTSTLIDSKTNEIIIYDWRAPISSMFYSCQLGKGSYKSPKGLISGDILLKRQYKIVDSKLKYFFDSNITINDEILQEVLSQNASLKMKSIVETIQKEQDVIIRDTQSDLVIVQGVAGSGKTSIALHRIAFLLYEGLSYKLNNNDILIISPNQAFSNYISNVLPQLGEENVEQLTLEDIYTKHLLNEVKRESRQEQLERLLLHQGNKETDKNHIAIKFKGSNEFVEILNRFIKYYENHIVEFKDIYYDGKVIEKRELLRDFFLKDKINMPLLKRLERIESMIFNKIKPLQKERRARIFKVVEKCKNHPFDMVEFSRLMSIKESRRIREYIELFSKVDYFKAYRLLFENKAIFYKIAKGLRLPENIGEILEETSKRLIEGQLLYEDCAPLLYMKIKIEGSNSFDEVKQVVIDEAQDYYPINYHIFSLIFRNAKMTVLGDFNQCVEKNDTIEIYDWIVKILNKKSTAKIVLNKGYRSSYEINAFNKKILYIDSENSAFKRHEEKPVVKKMNNIDLMEKEIIEDAQKLWKQGYKSVALICKTMKAAKDIYERLRDKISCKIIDDLVDDIENKLSIIPTYLSKGLEFDGVLVYDVSKKEYKTEFDRRLLYIACTRPLHRLYVYSNGEASEFIS